MTMTISGSGTITGLSAGGLPSATVTQATLATPVAGAGPAFSAYNSGTSVAASTWTKVTFSSEEFDTNNNFASSTFTPTVAGYYLFDACIGFAAMTTGGAFLTITKNGLSVKYGPICAGVSALGTQTSLSCIIYMNGSTDYVELYAFQTSGATKTIATGIADSYFQGSLVRGA